MGQVPSHNGGITVGVVGADRREEEGGGGRDREGGTPKYPQFQLWT